MFAACYFLHEPLPLVVAPLECIAVAFALSGLLKSLLPVLPIGIVRTALGTVVTVLVPKH